MPVTREDVRHILLLGTAIILGPLAGAALLVGLMRLFAWVF